MKVRDVMTTPIIEVAQTDTCQRAAQLMSEHRTGCLVVMSRAGLIEGIVTDRDLVINGIALGREPYRQQVGECMSEDYAGSHPRLVRADLELQEAVQVMEETGVRRLPVTEDGLHVVGILSLDEIALDLKRYLNAFLTVAGQYHHRPEPAPAR